MPKTHRRYDEEFKRRVIELYLHSNNILNPSASPRLRVNQNQENKYPEGRFNPRKNPPLV